MTRPVLRAAVPHRTTAGQPGRRALFEQAFYGEITGAPAMSLGQLLVATTDNGSDPTLFTLEPS